MTDAPRRRISQRDALPLAVKFRLSEYYDAKTNAIDFKDDKGNSVFKIDLNTGIMTIGTVTAFNTVVTFADDVTFAGDITVGGVLNRAVFVENFGAELTTGGTPAASDETQPAEGSDEAFDDDPVTKWLAGGTSSPYLQYQLTAAKTVRKYAMIAGDDNRDRDPKSWVLRGSNNGSDFTALHTVVDFWFGPRSIRKEFYLDNTTAYTYYRLDISANWGSADTQLAELQLYEQS